MSEKRKTAASSSRTPRKPSTSGPLGTTERIYTSGQGRSLQNEVRLGIFSAVLITQAINRLTEAVDRLTEATRRDSK